MKRTQPQPQLPQTSRPLFRAFCAIARRRLRRQFRAVRLLRDDAWPHTGGKLIVCINHPSWWDPLVAFLLAGRFAGRREHYAPMDSDALGRYGVLSKVGVFPIQPDTPRGAAQFLGAARSVLQRNGVLWITAQGHFTDVRVRPALLKPGLGHLLHHEQNVTVLPVAVEYCFWNQRLPEVLVHFGQPVCVLDGGSKPAAEWTRCCEQALQQAQDQLAAAALTRDERRFNTLLEGTRGMAGLYGLWQSLRAFVAGAPPPQDHLARPVLTGPVEPAGATNSAGALDRLGRR